MTLFVFLAGAGAAHATAGDDARLAFVNTGFFPTTTVVTAPAPCAIGEAALGGGIRPFSSGSIWVQESGPQTASGAFLATGERPGRWFSSMYNDSGADKSFAAYAVCSASSDATVLATTLSASTSPDGAKQASAPLMCATGQRAVGGGILGAGRVEASGPVDETGQPANTENGDIPRGWFNSVVTESTTPQPFRIYVLCSTASTATIVLDTERLQQNEQFSFGVTCPTTQRMLSGGVIGAIPRGELFGSAPAENNGLVYAGQNTNNASTLGMGWRASIRNIGAEATFKVAAVCEAATPTTPSDPTNPDDPTNPGAPSNDFTIDKLSRNRDKGTATLSLTIPGPGTVTVESPKLKPQALTAAAGGGVVVKLKAVGSAKRKHKRKGKVTLAAPVTFTPTGGTANTQTPQVKLKRD
jgi:hypothetical protein